MTTEGLVSERGWITEVHVSPKQQGALVLQVVPEMPHELTHVPVVTHAPEQQLALPVQGEPMAMHIPPLPASGGGVELASGAAAGQHAWLDWPQLSTQLPPQPEGMQHRFL
jgi:hypothetical protein